jgi:hypothetical protein
MATLDEGGDQVHVAVHVNVVDHDHVNLDVSASFANRQTVYGVGVGDTVPPGKLIPPRSTRI